jgi:hypothetical protein
MPKPVDKHDTYRAAAQLVASIAEGVSIESVSARGIVLKETIGRRPVPLRCSVLADIAIGLAGVAAVDRYGFGTPPPDEPGRHSACFHWAFNAQQLVDFALVRELIAGIDPEGNEDILLRAWEQAQSFIRDEATWEAIEFFAPLIGAAALDAAYIDYLCPDEG